MPQKNTKTDPTFRPYRLTFPTWATGRGLVLSFSFLCGALALMGDETLSGKSPFLPPGYGEEKAPPPPPPPPSQGPLSREIEFRSVVQIGGTYQFSLFSKKENKGYWIEESETVSDIRVDSFNPNNSTLIITKNGRSERLTMISATDSPLPVATTNTSGDSPKVKPPNPRRQANDSEGGEGKRRRVVPRRRVILPNSD